MDGNEIELMSNRVGNIEALNKIRIFLSKNTTKFKLNSLKLDAYEHRKKNYWSTIPEMAARAFNCYLIDKLSVKNARNDYLCYEFEFEDEQNLNAHPLGKERAYLNKLFDSLFIELIDKDIFTKKEAVLSTTKSTNNLIVVDKQLKFNF